MSINKGPAVAYKEEISKILDDISCTQIEKIKKAAKLSANCIIGDGLLHVFASGHSRMASEEMAPRFGSFLKGVHIMNELSLTNHTQVIGSNGHRQAMFLESVERFGEVILQSHFLEETDILLTISNSGLTPVVVDVALRAKDIGLQVIAITSVQHSKALPAKHSSGKKLIDIADIVLDTCNPPGEALVKIEGLADLVGPGSTIAAISIVNMLKCEIVAALVRLGQTPIIFVNSYFGEGNRSKQEECYGEYAEGIARMYSRAKKSTDDRQQFGGLTAASSAFAERGTDGQRGGRDARVEPELGVQIVEVVSSRGEQV